MVDFKKHLRQKAAAVKITDPLAIYEKLDRASDKGPLRPVQESILQKWHTERRGERDLILKLHTGQGKTLIGLLMLQSKLNEGAGPAVYLCANHYLANQTCQQAAQFGIRYVTLTKELPDEFLDSKSILITIVQKVFNGLSKFGLGTRSRPVGALLMDDAHACVDAIRDSCVIRLGREHSAYSELRDLFAEDLEKQGAGTFADLMRKQADAVLPVPYWSWQDKHRDVARILSAHSESNEITFTWPLIKDDLVNCTCIISGAKLEIVPTLPPIDEFGSYAKATHRVFMSATVANDAFLIKGLGVSGDTIKKPLIHETETWSGEKMILIPSLIGEDLDRSNIVHLWAKSVKNRPYGVVVLSPSFAKCTDWQKLGAVVADARIIDEKIDDLRAGRRDDVVVIVNRYDGIDLPDYSCRILIMDSKPYGESVTDTYMERCLEGSETIAMATARKIEQGLGRSVRGEKDFCVIMIIGPDLVREIRTAEARRFLSPQTQKQVEIGLDVVRFAEEEIEEEAGTKDEGTARKAFLKVINQCLQRDQGWKDFYESEMNEMQPSQPEYGALHTFEKERHAEILFRGGKIDVAKAVIQELVDQVGLSQSMYGWYVQEMARYEYVRSKAESNKLQIAAHKRNHRLLKPLNGMEFKKVALVSQRRAENCAGWISAHANFQELIVSVDAFLGHLQFGVGADDFEQAVDDLGRALGFATDRPDRDWKEGPDNLWALRDNDYLVIECKSEVALTRADINKDETDQMNRSAAWFTKNYAGANVKYLMITPARRVGKSAGFMQAVEIVRESKLEKLRKRVRTFFNEFSNVDLRDLSESKINEFFEAHKLSVDDILSEYSEKPFSPRSDRAGK